MLLAAGCQSRAAGTINAEKGILQWGPGIGAPAKPKLLVERLKTNDLGIAYDDYYGQYSTYGSVVQYFCGDDAKLRNSFVETFEKYLNYNHDNLYPDYDVPKDSNFDIYTYRPPYEFAQPAFLQWLRKHSNKSDIFEPKARQTNPYEGPVLHPWTDNGNEVDESFLQKTFGYAVYEQDDALILLNDNRYNPSRWFGPCNQVHHREQASLSLVINSKPGVYEETSKILHDSLSYVNQKKILMEYDIELSVEDFVQELKERTVWGFYGGYGPIQSPNGILSQTHRNILDGAAGKSFGGKPWDQDLRTFNLEWLESRIINASIQFGITVNFKQRDNTYRLMEFVISAKDHERHNWDLTPAKVFNDHTIDGGGNYDSSFYRSSIELLRDERFTDGRNEPVLVNADPYFAVPAAGMSSKRFKGVIDITRFYQISRKLKCFTGQKGSRGEHSWVGFEGDDLKLANPDERHGIEWAGFIFENHGPFKVKAKINKLSIKIEPK